MTASTPAPNFRHAFFPTTCKGFLFIKFYINRIGLIVRVSPHLDLSETSPNSNWYCGEHIDLIECVSEIATRSNPATSIVSCWSD